jgi:thiopurine S-methyltransferase
VHHEFWHERWQSGQTGFHQSAVHPFLERWWPTLDVPAGARVYVPLCGRSLDMAWLASRGHAVVGSELSPIAIGQFFAGQGLDPRREQLGAFVRHEAGPYTILEGDALALTPRDLGPVAAAYDRAALVALPPDLRVRHAATLAALLPADAPMLLVAFEYPQAAMTGPPFSVDSAEIEDLFGIAFRIRELERIEVIAESPRFLDAGLRTLHEVTYSMERKR